MTNRVDNFGYDEITYSCILRRILNQSSIRFMDISSVIVCVCVCVCTRAFIIYLKMYDKCSSSFTVLISRSNDCCRYLGIHEVVIMRKCYVS